MGPFDFADLECAEKDISALRLQAETLDLMLKKQCGIDIMENAEMDMDAYKTRIAELRAVNRCLIKSRR